MRGLYFENHNGLIIESGQGIIRVGHLDLEAGSYMLWGKLSVGVSVSNGLPPPAYPYTSGVAYLVLGDADDEAIFRVKPEVAENSDTLSLMCAASIDRSRRARLSLINLYRLPIICFHVKMVALQVDTLVQYEVGRDGPAPEDQEEREERLRTAILRAKLTDRPSISELMKEE